MRASLRLAGLAAEVYFLVECLTPMGGLDGGLFKGRVVQIGWDESYVVAWRSAISSDNPDGWVFLDVATRHGPYSGTGFELQKGRLPALREIHLADATEVWTGISAPSPSPRSEPQLPSPEVIEDH